MLTPEIQANVLALHFGKKMKVRAIARELGIDRKTVRRILSRDSVRIQTKPCVRASLLDPHKSRILGLLNEDPEVSNIVILQRIRDEGYNGGKTILRDWIGLNRSRIKPKREGFFKLDFPVGEVAQVDWGELGDLIGDGIKIHCFVMVLCHSRLLYVEVTRSEKFADFIRCHENAFKYFDNHVPQCCWYDNLTTAVTERIKGLVRFNSRFLAFLGHHHIRPHACNPARGNEKGRVEDGVKYVKMNFLPTRKFKDFSDVCDQLAQWRDDIANMREHRATRKIPRLLFDNEEKPKLRTANLSPYETDEVISERIKPDFHFTYETNEYSVPWTLVGEVITIRINADELKFFYRDRFVTKHSRSYKKHQKPFTHPEHEEGLKEIKPQGKTDHDSWKIKTLESYGPELAEYLGFLQYSHRSLRQEISRLLALATVYGETNLAKAVAFTLKHGSIGVDQVELAVKTICSDEKISPRPALMNLKDDRLTRVPPKIDLRRYDELIFNSRKRPDESASSESQPPDSWKNYKK